MKVLNFTNLKIHKALSYADSVKELKPFIADCNPKPAPGGAGLARRWRDNTLSALSRYWDSDVKLIKLNLGGHYVYGDKAICDIDLNVKPVSDCAIVQFWTGGDFNDIKYFVAYPAS